MAVLSAWHRLAAGVAAAALVAAPALGQGGGSLEFAVKATYLYKFAPFVTWPPAAMPADGEPFRICVVGQDPFGGVLEEAVRGQQIQGHAVAITRMSAVDSHVRCQIVFAGKPDGQSTAATLNAVAGQPVLTVTDASRGVDGGMIEFVMDHGRVRFTVNDRAASQNGLQVSSKLLALAVRVER